MGKFAAMAIALSGIGLEVFAISMTVDMWAKGSKGVIIGSLIMSTGAVVGALAFAKELWEVK